MKIETPDDSHARQWLQKLVTAQKSHSVSQKQHMRGHATHFPMLQSIADIHSRPRLRQGALRAPEPALLLLRAGERQVTRHPP
jgi:hypothetical protein